MKKKIAILFTIVFTSIAIPVAVKAEPSNNPIFATIEYVNQIISDVTLDLQGQIDALEERLGLVEDDIGSLDTRVTDLENIPSPSPLPSPSSKALKAFDANGVELGIIMQTIFDGYHIFNIFIPSIERYVRIYTTPYSGEVGPRTHVKFTTTNCTGTAYTNEITPNNIEILANQVIPISPGKYYALDLNGNRTNIVAKSSLQGPSLWCRTDANVGSFDVYPLTPVDLPFAEPVGMPLQFKYE